MTYTPPRFTNWFGNQLLLLSIVILPLLLSPRASQALAIEEATVADAQAALMGNGGLQTRE